MFAVHILITKLHGTSLASHSLLAVLTVGYLKAGVNENTVAGGVACAFDLPILHDELAVQRHPLSLALLQHSTSPYIDLAVVILTAFLISQHAGISTIKRSKSVNTLTEQWHIWVLKILGAVLLISIS